MQRLRTGFSLFGSFGFFGVILLLITLVVLSTWQMIRSVSQTVGAVHGALVKLEVLEDHVTSQLLDMDINAVYYVYAGGDDDYLQAYQQADSRLRESLAGEEWGETRLLQEDQDIRTALLASIDAHNQAFAVLQTAILADDTSAVETAQASLATHAAQARETIENWTFQIETQRAQASETQEERVRLSILIGGLGLVLLPLLGYWAFALAGQITRPILALTDFVIAIQSEHAHMQLPPEVIERGDNLGQLAHDVEALARALRTRREAKQSELAGLRAELKEERRRKRT